MNNVVYGFNGLPIEIIEEINEKEVKHINITYNSWNKRIKKVEKTVVDGVEVDEYIIYYGYHDNGELSYLKDNKGTEYYFDEKGLPIK